MGAAAMMQCKHSPEGGIQWLLVKPRVCSIWRCDPHRTAASAWQSKSPAFDVYFFVVNNFVVAHNHS